MWWITSGSNDLYVEGAPAILQFTHWRVKATGGKSDAILATKLFIMLWSSKVITTFNTSHFHFPFPYSTNSMACWQHSSESCQLRLQILRYGQSIGLNGNNLWWDSFWEWRIAPRRRLIHDENVWEYIQQCWSFPWNCYLEYMDYKYIQWERLRGERATLRQASPCTLLSFLCWHLTLSRHMTYFFFLPTSRGIRRGLSPRISWHFQSHA